MIAQKTIEEVLNRTNIVDIVGQYVKLRRSGSNYFGLCPFHNEDTASFCVSESKQIFNCFGCHISGNAIKFMQEIEHLTFVEAVKYLAEKCNVSIIEDERFSNEKNNDKDLMLKIHNDTAQIYYNILKTKEGEKGYNYFKNRKLTDSTITHFGLGYSPSQGNFLYNKLKEKGYKDLDLQKSGLVTFSDSKVYDRFRDRVMFPILNTNNNVIGFGGRILDNSNQAKYLNSSDSIIFDKSKNLFGLNFAKKNRDKYFILCEGYMDVISLHQAGFDNAIASLGTALTENQAKLISRYKKEVILSYDSDDAGINAALRAISILRNYDINVKVLNMSPYKDPDEFIKNLGSEEYNKRIKNAKNFFLFQCEIIKNKFDLNDPTSKTDYYKEIIKLLSNFKEKIERENYLKAVCYEQNIDEIALQEMLNNLLCSGNINKSKFYNHTNNKDNYEFENFHYQNILLSLLIENIILLPNVKNYLSDDDFLGDYYKIIFNEIRSLDTACVISQFIETIKEKYNDQQLNVTLNNIIFDNDENVNSDVKNRIISLIKKVKLDTLNRMLENESFDLSKINYYKQKINELNNMDINI